MAYAVKELFYTLQGEGANTGRASVFLRFSGCNLWTGREQDRERGKGGCARWCDTEFFGVDGDGGGRFESANELADAVRNAWAAPMPSAPRRPLVVCTGGEPLLQLDRALIDALHERGFEIAIETNGTLPCPSGVDWVCVSPKQGGDLVVRSGDELKLVWPQEGLDPEMFESMDFGQLYLQPLDDLCRQKNVETVIAYCLAHPRWRMSVQTHKTLGIR